MNNEREYTVEYLIVKRIKVREHDEIQAEIQAWNKLTPNQRAAVHKYRVMDGETPMFDFMSPDREWLASNEEARP